MSDESIPKPNPELTREAIKARFQRIREEVQNLVALAEELDWLGGAAQHLPHSEQQTLANTRDDLDFFFNAFVGRIAAWARRRAETTRCHDLLLNIIGQREGDGPDALHLMRRYHELFGDETDEDGEVGPETCPDSFAWDTYLRVSALAELAEKFPKHLRHSARQMHGWPMIVSRHIDGQPAFQQIAERLEVGRDYPLDVGARKKRGSATPLLQYLEPLIWRLHVLREFLADAKTAPAAEEVTPQDRAFWMPAGVPEDDAGFARRIYGLWWEFGEPEPTPDVLALLRRLPTLPALTQKTAGTWAREIIAPLIMLEDAKTRERCEIPALRNIWRHRAVKSPATFKSRLQSAVTDVLKRFARVA